MKNWCEAQTSWQITGHYKGEYF